MKGLVKYDLMQLAGTSKKSFYLLYFVGLAAVGVMLGGGTIFSYMAVMIGCMTGVSFFSYESWYHWDSYCAVMPLSNRQIVVSRYISLLIVTGCGVLWGIVIGVLVCLGQQHFGWLKLGTGSEYIISVYPVQVQIADILLVAAVVLALGFVAAWYPSRKIKVEN